MRIAPAASSPDRISNLPDAVISHILSFLPTKAAAATSVLSKRWTPLWLSVPTLHLEEQINLFDHVHDVDDDVDYEHLNLIRSFNFVRMVYSAILKRDATQTLKTFTLKTAHHSLCNSSDVTAWVNAAIQRGVEHLDLDLSRRMKLPSGIIGSKTLVSLNLSRLWISHVSNDGFPSLKIMRLDNIIFKTHRCLLQILSGCPILEDLYLDDLTLRNENDLIINVEEFQILGNLTSAVVLFTTTYIPLKCLCNARTLSITEGFPEFEVACTFHNLTSLELMVDIYNWHWFLGVLRHCPKLQNLEIVKLDGADDDDFGDQRWVQPQFVPPGCLSSHLKTCALSNYQGFDSDSELQFVKYIMENAKVLCTLGIYSGIFSNPQAKHEFIEKLSSFPCCSATCELRVKVI